MPPAFTLVQREAKRGEGSRHSVGRQRYSSGAPGAAIGVGLGGVPIEAPNSAPRAGFCENSLPSAYRNGSRGA